jgi:hypothetical protein
MQTNPESAAVEAVAHRIFSDRSGFWGPWRNGPRPEFADPSARFELAYPQSALDALRGEVERLRGALERIAAPHDCGCKPCTSKCRSDLALQITVEAMREEAIEALTKESP